MVSEYVQHVLQHPPRCIAGLNPKPARHSKPALQLPSHLSIYHRRYDDTNTASFVIGCPCGNRAVYLLGYHANVDGARKDTVFVGPLSLECPKCNAVSQFFDPRKHGYDGEQGVSTHITGEGQAGRYACPKCGVAPMILNPNFCYQGAESLQGEMREHMQDFFDGFDIVGQCTQYNALVEVTWFECD